MNEETNAPPSTGLLSSVRRFADNLVALFHNRLEILSTDLAEERMNLVRTLIVVVVILFCLQLGILLTVLFVVLSAAAADRLAVVGIAAGVLLAVAVAGALWLWWWLKTRPPFFGSTMAEFKKDRERLGGKP